MVEIFLPMLGLLSPTRVKWFQLHVKFPRIFNYNHTDRSRKRKFRKRRISKTRKEEELQQNSC